MPRGLAALWFISLIFPLGSETLSRGLFPTRVRGGQTERRKEGAGGQLGREEKASLAEV